jgi:hypothetical protein
LGAKINIKIMRMRQEVGQGLAASSGVMERASETVFAIEWSLAYGSRKFAT